MLHVFLSFLFNYPLHIYFLPLKDHGKAAESSNIFLTF